MNDLPPYILTDITQIVTALGVILTAVSSIMNRMALNRMNKQIDTKAAEVKVETKNAAVATAKLALSKIDRVHVETMEKVAEIQKVAEAVNAEVVQKVHDAGVAAGKEIAGNGDGKH